LIKNDFYSRVENAYENNATQEELKELLGRGRAKKGMFNGDLVEGELEIGQISGLLDEILPAGEIVRQIITEFRETQKSIHQISL
jgi:enoyl-[acyl-carrier protein] reductase II